ncbi:MAG: outer membrane homotrimeric porin [Desulfovibrio sp.]|uniref:outer membrane homotrimeric porin n=1 Tax=Desulfovibrio sp. TaxID=885 RepID=UPI001A6528A4|nr:outer membrane homotrimeric porin [Desulfovibrio sp.]MBD5416452.1 outer membrane homotrimeric porin [Desulfovibrio sp.]
MKRRRAFCLHVLLLLLPGILWAHAARAVDFKPRGQWIASFGYGMNGKFVKNAGFTGFSPGQDNFNAREKVALQLDAEVSRNLSGSVYLDIGDIIWGQQESGGALGADGHMVKVGNAFIDWSLPRAPLRVRMGIQSIKTPAYASGNSIFNGSVAAVVANWAFSECLSVTGAWARPYNDNTRAKGGGPVFGDNVDAFGLLVPLQLEKAGLIPWAVMAVIEPHAARAGDAAYPFGNFTAMGGDAGNFREGMFPAGGSRHQDFSDANGARAVRSRATAFWAGLTGKFDLLAHLRVSFDAEYGETSWQDDRRLDRRGWFATLCVDSEYDWGMPGVYAWYASGDDANPANGSERLPALDPGNSINYSPLAYDGSHYIERNALIGNNLAGTLGVGVRAAHLHLWENVSQTFYFNYIRGTNSRAMARKMSREGLWANGMALSGAQPGPGADLGMPNLYLTQGDFAVEIAGTGRWRFSEGLTLFYSAGWIGLSQDKGTGAWGARHTRGEAIPATANAWNVNLSFIASF